MTATHNTVGALTLYGWTLKQHLHRADCFNVCMFSPLYALLIAFTYYTNSQCPVYGAKLLVMTFVLYATVKLTKFVLDFQDFDRKQIRLAFAVLSSESRRIGRIAQGGQQ